jgi:uncharacterized protein YwgA
VNTSGKNIAALLNSSDLRFDIGSVASRKLLQKIVYLAQQLGLPVHYNYGWYIHGPYSPKLANDYYELKSQATLGDSISNYRLADEYSVVSERLNKLLKAKPSDAEAADWAELLASVAFLRRESDYDDEKTHSFLKERKPHVIDHYKKAKRALQSVGLF